MDFFLIIVVLVMAVLIALGVVGLIIAYGHPDDKTQAWLPKIVTIFGFWLAFAAILAIPYDVANRRGDGGGLRLDVLWQIIFIVMAVMIGFVVPYTFFYYESQIDEDDIKGFCDRQGVAALKSTFFFLIFFIGALLCMWGLLNETEVPVWRIAQNTTMVVAYDQQFPQLQRAANLTNICYAPFCTAGVIYWNMVLTFPVYIIAFLSFVGWWFFTFFAAVGLFALPMDLINDFRTRPKPISHAVYFDEKQKLGQRCTKLIELGKKLQNLDDLSGSRGFFERRQDAANMKMFEQHVWLLKKDVKMLETAHSLTNYNPLIPIGGLILGIISLGISFMWILHIILYVLPNEPIHPFLNDFFVQLENISGFSLFGVTAFAVFSFYLLWACIKGNFKLGIRFAFIKMYPMELKNTYMNAFLANTWVILLCSIPCVQFCATAFPIYTRYTDIDILFGTQIKNLKFLRYFYAYDVFIFILIIVAFLSLLYFIARPNDQAKKIEKILEEIANERM